MCISQGSLYCKELASMIIGAAESEFCQTGQQYGNWAGADITILEQNFFFLRKISVKAFQLNEAHPFY